MITHNPMRSSGRHIVTASSPAWPAAWRRERTIPKALMPAMNVPATRRDPVTACGKAVSAMGLVSSSPMSMSSARPVSGL